MAFLKSLLHGAETAAKIAAPIVAGAFGGPIAAAGVSAAENKLSKRKVASASSASSIGEARSQDKARMSQQYGLGGPRDY